ncbi:MAG TPA: hypothetical protein VKG45_10975 [Actinomycetes bacterium]|nr:hypothetical protein [Actinomycetes bacterium]
MAHTPGAMLAAGIRLLVASLLLGTVLLLVALSGGPVADARGGRADRPARRVPSAPARAGPASAGRVGSVPAFRIGNAYAYAAGWSAASRLLGRIDSPSAAEGRARGRRAGGAGGPAATARGRPPGVGAAGPGGRGRPGRPGRRDLPATPMWWWRGSDPEGRPGAGRARPGRGGGDRPARRGSTPAARMAPAAPAAPADPAASVGDGEPAGGRRPDPFEGNQEARGVATRRPVLPAPPDLFADLVWSGLAEGGKGLGEAVRILAWRTSWLMQTAVSLVPFKQLEFFAPVIWTSTKALIAELQLLGDREAAARLWHEVFVKLVRPEYLEGAARQLRHSFDQLSAAAALPVGDGVGSRLAHLLLSAGVGLGNLVQAFHALPSRLDDPDIARRKREYADAMGRARRNGAQVLAALDLLRQDVTYAALGVGRAPASRPAPPGTATGGTATSGADTPRAAASQPRATVGAVIAPARRATPGAAAAPIPPTMRGPGSGANLGPGRWSAVAMPAPRPPAASVTASAASLAGLVASPPTASAAPPGTTSDDGRPAGSGVSAPAAPDAAPAAGRVAQPQAAGRRPGPRAPGGSEPGTYDALLARQEAVDAGGGDDAGGPGGGHGRPKAVTIVESRLVDQTTGETVAIVKDGYLYMARSGTFEGRQVSAGMIIDPDDNVWSPEDNYQAPIGKFADLVAAPAPTGPPVAGSQPGQAVPGQAAPADGTGEVDVAAGQPSLQRQSSLVPSPGAPGAPAAAPAGASVQASADPPGGADADLTAGVFDSDSPSGGTTLSASLTPQEPGGDPSGGGQSTA